MHHKKDNQFKQQSNLPDLISSTQLECVPRGHDYYRTNNAFAIDPTDPNILYAGIEYKGVYKSLDGGASWHKSDTGVRGYAMQADSHQKCVQELGRIVIDPQDAHHLLLSRVESPSTRHMLFGETAGLYESRDSGASWRQIISNTMNASGSRGIAFDPQNSNTIYYGVNNMKPSFKVDNKASAQLFNTTGIVYKTTDGGKTWTELPTGAEEGFRTIGIFPDKTNSQNLWLGTYSQDDKGNIKAQQKGLLKTADGGRTWQNHQFTHPIADFAVSPTHFNHVYTSLQTTDSPPESYYSLDGSNFHKAESDNYVMIARYDPYDTAGLHMLGYAPYGNPSLYESNDGGKTWQRYADVPKEVTAKAPGEYGSVQISEILWHPTDENTLYMSGSGAMAWKSTDKGKTWQTILSLDKLGGPNKNSAGATKSSQPDT